MRQQRSDSVLAPRSTVHKHCNPWRILGVSSNYFRKDEIFTLEVPVRKHRKSNNLKAETYKEFENKERTIDWYEEYKLNKIILLNYTERGKQLINIGIRNKYQKQGGQINVKGRENPLTGVIKIGVVQY